MFLSLFSISPFLQRTHVSSATGFSSGQVWASSVTQRGAGAGVGQPAVHELPGTRAALCVPPVSREREAGQHASLLV